jgi:hypothetical protein
MSGSGKKQVGDMLTNTWEVLARADKHGYRYLVQVVVVAECDWLAEIEGEKRVAAALRVPVAEVETLRRRRLTNEERLAVLEWPHGQTWTREPITGSRQE